MTAPDPVHPLLAVCDEMHHHQGCPCGHCTAYDAARPQLTVLIEVAEAGLRLRQLQHQASACPDDRMEAHVRAEQDLQEELEIKQDAYRAAYPGEGK